MISFKDLSLCYIYLLNALVIICLLFIFQNILQLCACLCLCVSQCVCLCGCGPLSGGLSLTVCLVSHSLISGIDLMFCSLDLEYYCLMHSVPGILEFVLYKCLFVCLSVYLPLTACKIFWIETTDKLMDLHIID